MRKLTFEDDSQALANCPWVWLQINNNLTHRCCSIANNLYQQDLSSYMCSRDDRSRLPRVQVVLCPDPALSRGKGLVSSLGLRKCWSLVIISVELQIAQCRIMNLIIRFERNYWSTCSLPHYSNKRVSLAIAWLRVRLASRNTAATSMVHMLLPLLDTCCGYNFREWPKTSKFVEVFSLEIFPLCSMYTVW